MTQGTLHPVPRGRDVVLEQIRIVALSLRIVALVFAVVLGIVTVLVAIDTVGGRGATWFDSDEWFPLTFISFFYSFAVWRRDRPFGRAFLWTLPVERRRLALAKVFAGWVWLMAALAALIVWELVLAFLAGVAGAQITPLVAFVGTTATYLLGSAVALGLRHPLRWLLGAAGVLFLVRFLTEAFDPYGIDTFLRSNDLSSVIEGATTVWPFLGLGAGLVALWAAISRHRENR